MWVCALRVVNEALLIKINIFCNDLCKHCWFGTEKRYKSHQQIALSYILII
jgi:hypothetical protein